MSSPPNATDAKPETPVPVGFSELSFEKLLEMLEGVVQKLESGDLPLERSVALFEEGVRLRRFAEQRLDEAERRVEVLLASEEGVVRTGPFSGERDGR